MLEDEGEYKCRADFKKARTRYMSVYLKVIGKSSLYLSFLMLHITIFLTNKKKFLQAEKPHNVCSAYSAGYCKVCGFSWCVKYYR